MAKNPAIAPPTATGALVFQVNRTICVAEDMMDYIIIVVLFVCMFV